MRGKYSTKTFPPEPWRSLRDCLHWLCPFSPSRLCNCELLKNTNWNQSQPNEITHVKILCKEFWRFKLLPLLLVEAIKASVKWSPCDWLCVCSVPGCRSRREKEVCQTSHLVLSSPKQCIDHFSSNYFSSCFVWISVCIFLCLFPYLSLQASSSASLIVLWICVEFDLCFFKRFVSFHLLSQACLTNIC